MIHSSAGEALGSGGGRGLLSLHIESVAKFPGRRRGGEILMRAFRLVFYLNVLQIYRACDWVPVHTSQVAGLHLCLVGFGGNVIKGIRCR